MFDQFYFPLLFLAGIAPAAASSILRFLPSSRLLMVCLILERDGEGWEPEALLAAAFGVVALPAEDFGVTASLGVRAFMGLSILTRLAEFLMIGGEFHKAIADVAAAVEWSGTPSIRNGLET